MPTSAPGSSAAGARRPTAGFTLLELLLVVALLAIAASGVTLALRESGEQQLAREGQRVAALLEAARARSRATGAPIVWQADAEGFRFLGASEAPGAPTPWLAPATAVREPVSVVLGPDPVLVPQVVVLGPPGQGLQVASDGLRAFGVRGTDAPAGGP